MKILLWIVAIAILGAFFAISKMDKVFVEIGNMLIILNQNYFTASPGWYSYAIFVCFCSIAFYAIRNLTRG